MFHQLTQSSSHASHAVFVHKYCVELALCCHGDPDHPVEYVYCYGTAKEDDVRILTTTSCERCAQLCVTLCVSERELMNGCMSLCLNVKTKLCKYRTCVCV